MESVLGDCRVIDFTRQMAGPYGTLLLGDFGADVIKVESMPKGDPTRNLGTAFIDGVSGVFLIWNRNKRSLAVDMRSAEGHEIIRSLLTDADIVAENYRPGVADQIGIGYDAVSRINSRIVYLSVSAFGPVGPLKDRPGTDPVVQAVSGVMSLTGECDGEPMLVGIPIADYSAAMVSVQGALLGLLARHRTGRGQRVDVPMLAALSFGLTTRLASYWANGSEPKREGNAHSAVAPYQLYAARDGNIVAGAWTNDGWPRFCIALGREDLIKHPDFSTNVDRMNRRDVLNAVLKPIFASATVAEWEQRFSDANALFGQVNTLPELLDHPQFRALDMVRTVKHPQLGEIPQLAPPIMMSETPGTIRRAPPLYGQHTAEILREIGYSDTQIDRLAGEGKIHLADPVKQSVS